MHPNAFASPADSDFPAFGSPRRGLGFEARLHSYAINPHHQRATVGQLIRRSAMKIKRYLDPARARRLCVALGFRMGAACTASALPTSTDRAAGNWSMQVDRPMYEPPLQTVRQSVARGVPLWVERWRRRMATRLGLNTILRPRGRTPKASKHSS